MLDVIDLTERDLLTRRYDAILCCSGYEQRARFLPKRLLKAGALGDICKWVISFPDFVDHPERRKNDTFFRSYGFSEFCSGWEEYGSVSGQLLSLARANGQPFRLLVDYSAMRRTIYSEIILMMNKLGAAANIDVTFAYSVGVPTGNHHPKIISDYLLLPGFEGDTDSQREKFAIYCLGFEPIILHSIHEWIEPSASLAFYAEPGMGVRSGAKCLQINRRFLEENDCKAYPQTLYSVREFVRVFVEVVKTESVQRDIMVFSCGPKPFVLASLLACPGHVAPAHVYARGAESQAVDSRAIGKVIGTSVSFVQR